MLYWSLCEETVCFEADVSETLWFSMSFQRKCLETKRITSVAVIHWTLQPGCRRFWKSPFVSLGTFSLCHNLLCRHMPFSDVWDQVWAAESDADDCSTPCATMAHCYGYLVLQVCGTAQNMPWLQLSWKCQLLLRNKLPTWKFLSG